MTPRVLPEHMEGWLDLVDRECEVSLSSRFNLEFDYVYLKT